MPLRLRLRCAACTGRKLACGVSLPDALEVQARSALAVQQHLEHQRGSADVADAVRARLRRLSASLCARSRLTFVPTPSPPQLRASVLQARCREQRRRGAPTATAALPFRSWSALGGALRRRSLGACLCGSLYGCSPSLSTACSAAQSAPFCASLV